MKRRYFIAEGAEAEQVVKEGLSKAQEAGDRLDSFLKKYGATTTWGRRDHAAHVAYICNPGDALPEVVGLKFQDYRYSDGIRYALFSPDKRSKAGKLIREEMNGLRLFNFSNFAVSHFKVDRHVAGNDGNSRSGMSLFLTSAGYVKEKLIFAIPFSDQTEENQKFTIPDCFREIKHSEYIALTEE